MQLPSYRALRSAIVGFLVLGVVASPSLASQLKSIYKLSNVNPFSISGFDESLGGLTSVKFTLNAKIDAMNPYDDPAGGLQISYAFGSLSIYNFSAFTSTVYDPAYPSGPICLGLDNCTFGFTNKSTTLTSASKLQIFLGTSVGVNTSATLASWSTSGAIGNNFQYIAPSTLEVDYNYTAAALPEPGTAGLIGAAGIAFAIVQRSRRKVPRAE